ncbi:MAG: DsbA family protein [Pseudomonadota bacterium]
MRRQVVGLGLGIMLACGTAVPAMAENSSREAIEAVVRELLEREPGLVVEAIQRYQVEQEAARLAAARANIVAQRAELTAAEHPSVGPEDAPVTLVEFFDYRCGFCRRMAPTVAGVVADSPDVRQVFIDFPVLGPDSLRAAQAGLAAWRQNADVYPAFHAALMAAEDLSAPAIMTLAEDHDLDTDQLLVDMQGDDVRARLERNFALARALGIDGTPSYVIGDQLLPGAIPAARLHEALSAARAG